MRKNLKLLKMYGFLFALCFDLCSSHDCHEIGIKCKLAGNVEYISNVLNYSTRLHPAASLP